VTEESAAVALPMANNNEQVSADKAKFFVLVEFRQALSAT
jgi:hypothetical protein